MSNIDVCTVVLIVTLTKLSIFLNFTSSEFPILSWWFIYGLFFLSVLPFSKPPCSWFQLGPERVPRLGEVTAVTLPRTLEDQEWEGPWDGGLLAIHFSGNDKALILWKLPFILAPPLHSPTSSCIRAGFWDSWTFFGKYPLQMLWICCISLWGIFCDFSEVLLKLLYKLLKVLSPSFFPPSSFPPSLSVSVFLYNTHPGAHTHVDTHVHAHASCTEMCGRASGSEKEGMEVRWWWINYQGEICF